MSCARFVDLALVAALVLIVACCVEYPPHASGDTHPKDGDVQQAPLVSGAVAKPDALTPAAQKDSPDV